MFCFSVGRARASGATDDEVADALDKEDLVAQLVGIGAAVSVNQLRPESITRVQKHGAYADRGTKFYSLNFTVFLTSRAIALLHPPCKLAIILPRRGPAAAPAARPAAAAALGGRRVPPWK